MRDTDFALGMRPSVEHSSELSGPRLSQRLICSESSQPFHGR